MRQQSAKRPPTRPPVRMHARKERLRARAGVIAGSAAAQSASICGEECVSKRAAIPGRSHTTSPRAAARAGPRPASAAARLGRRAGAPRRLRSRRPTQPGALAVPARRRTVFKLAQAHVGEEALEIFVGHGLLAVWELGDREVELQHARRRQRHRAGDHGRLAIVSALQARPRSSHGQKQVRRGARRGPHVSFRKQSWLPCCDTSASFRLTRYARILVLTSCSLSSRSRSDATLHCRR